MSLDPGWRLDRYEIVELIGRGGIGEVYRAYDAHLERAVALKVLSEEFTGNERLRARFEREAKTISSLNHPNICVLHDVGEAAVDANGDGGSAPSRVHYLVMELCEGETLAEALRAGPLRIEQVFDYGIEIAEGLAKAHRAGIIHRDLKPANIAVTREGIKILDFGLARQGTFATTGADSTTDLRDDLTGEGQIVGTVRYMPPEVLGGRKADPRSDIFSLGAVLYEMVTGAPAFSGETRSEVIASIVKEDPPPISEARPTVPRALQMLIGRCLAKDPDDRWESAHDIAEQLREIRDWATHPEPDSASPRPSKRWGVVAALIVVAALAATVGWLLRTRDHSPSVVRFSIPVRGYAWQVAISPDGKRVVYLEQNPNPDEVAPVLNIRIQDLSQYEPTDLVDAGHGAGPFSFSPSGQSIGYWKSGTLRTIPVAGGANETVLVHNFRFSRGVTWGYDGYIYYCPTIDGGIWRVPEGGGQAEVVTVPDIDAGENSHRLPYALPDGKSLLFTIRPAYVASMDDAKIAVLSLETRLWRVIHEGGYSARYMDGFIVFARGNDLYAAPVEEGTWAFEGPPERVVEGIAHDPTGAKFDLTRDGDLVYLPASGPFDRTSFFLEDPDGRRELLGTIDLRADRIALSPDRTKLALTATGANDQIWVYDLERRVATQLTYERDNTLAPVWSADGRYVFYGSDAERAIMRVPLDRSTEPEVVLPYDSRGSGPQCVSPDGQSLVYGRISEKGDFDIWSLPLRGERIPRPLIQTSFNERDARISPDGKWIAYMGEGRERREIFIQSLESPGARWQVSRGLSEPPITPVPRWSADGRQLFYRRGGRLYAVRIEEEANGPRISKPEQIADLGDRRPTDWDVIGNRILTMELPDARSGLINVVLNWRAEVERKFNHR